jgi:hypothetical protein
MEVTRPAAQRPVGFRHYFTNGGPNGHPPKPRCRSSSSPTPSSHRLKAYADPRVLLPRICSIFLTGISRIRFTEKVSNSEFKCLLSSIQTGVTRYTVPPLLRRSRGRPHTITPTLFKTLRSRHCIGPTLWWQVTGVPARVLFSGHKSSVSST